MPGELPNTPHEERIANLEEESIRYRALVDSMNDGFGVIDKGGKLTYVNARWASMLEYEPNEMVGHSLVKFVNEKNRAILDDNVRKRTKGLPSQYELEWLSKNGKLVPTIVSGAPLVGENGLHMGSYAVITDITEIRHVEDALRENERFLSSVFSSIQDGINILDSDRNILRVNPTMEEWYAQAMPLIGKKCYEVHGGSAPCENCPADTTLETGKAASEIVPRRDASGKAIGWLDLHSFPLRDRETGEVTGIIEYVRDITDRRRAEEELRESETRYRLLAEHVKDIIWITDLNLVLTFVTPSVKEQLGYTVSEIVGKSLEDIMTPESMLLAKRTLVEAMVAMRKNRELDSNVALRLGLYHKNGRRVMMEVNRSFLRDDEGKPIGIIGVARNLAERIRAEDALRESEAKFRSIFESIPLGMHLLRLDEDGDLILSEANPAGRHTFSMDDGDFIGKKIKDVIPDPPGSDIVRHLQNVIKNGSTWLTEDVIRKNNDVKSAFQVTAFRALPEMIVVTYSDLTERRKAEEALKASEEKFRQMFEQSPIGIELFDADGNHVDANRAILELGGISSLDDLQGFNLFDDPNLPSILKEKIRQGESVRHEVDFDFGKVTETGLYETSRRGTAYLDANIVPLGLKTDGSPTGYLSQILDITEKTEAIMALKESEEKYRMLIDSSLQGIAILQGDPFRISFANPALAKTLGYTVGELMNFQPSELDHILHHEDRATIFQRFRDILEGRTTPEHFEARVNRKDGGLLWFELTGGKVTYAGEPAVQAAFVDVTDRKKAEMNIRTANERSTLYLDILGHDITNQMQAILGGAALLRHTAGGPGVAEQLDQILESAEKCAKIITKVKMTEDLMVVPLGPRLLDDVLRKSVGMMTSMHKDVKFVSDIRATEATIQADRFLEHIFNNVIDNAIDKNPHDIKKVWISMTESGNGYEVTIEDNGPGISTRLKPKLFDTSRRFGGVGLHQAKHIVEKYGGRIEAFDRVPGQPGRGAGILTWFPKTARRD
ncbi:MAG: PAS domain S-box protein [Candidatus Thorarchaeota archaeon]|nr:PAS domain S-box protein [Candidatus Thorarchaeota archaeon]